MRTSLALVVVLSLIVIECATLFVIFVPVVHDSHFIPCYSGSVCSGAGIKANYTASISFHYLNVGAVYGVCGGYQVLDARQGINFCFANTSALIEGAYTINGLTCPVPKDYLSYSSVIYLLPLVTTSPLFLSLTNGMPFVFGNAENITNRMQQIGNQPPVHLPDVVEMVFYNNGPTTSCSNFHPNTAQVIDVQVPIQNGGFNLTGASYHASPR